MGRFGRWAAGEAGPTSSSLAQGLGEFSPSCEGSWSSSLESPALVLLAPFPAAFCFAFAFGFAFPVGVAFAFALLAAFAFAFFLRMLPLKLLLCGVLLLPQNVSFHFLDHVIQLFLWVLIIILLLGPGALPLRFSWLSYLGGSAFSTAFSTANWTLSSKVRGGFCNGALTRPANQPQEASPTGAGLCFARLDITALASFSQP